MALEQPVVVAIDPDEYHAENVGRLADGRQFFLTTPFVPATPEDPGREFIALYIFDADGVLLDAQIEDLGTRCLIAGDNAKPYPQGYLAELGEYDKERIRIQPFEVERFGLSFGLLPVPPEDDDDTPWFEIHPGNYMAFTEPFDSGDYDT